MSELSLRRSLITRTAVALAIIGIAGATAAYALGYRYANLAYDLALLDDVETLADQVSLHDGKLQVNLPPVAQKWLLADEGERVIWQVIDLVAENVVDGNGTLGDWHDAENTSSEPHYRNVTVGNTQFRVAYVRKVVDPTDHPVLIEIGETLGKRVRMASNILAATLVVMITMVVAAAALIWSGVLKALMPLSKLELEAEKRSSTNLTPLESALAPKEVRGLIHSINDMMQRLTHSIETQRSFTANAAHQLRTPLAGLKLQAQIVLRQSLDDATREHLLEIEREAERAAHLIDQLLTLSKAESDELVLARTQVDLARVSRNIIERHLPQALEKNIDIGYEGCSGGAFVDGNEVLLAEMLSNLVNNAIRYTGKNGKVTLATEITAEEVKVAVTDNGPGIPETEHDKLFLRLYRSDSSRHTDGAGLGLAIVNEIAHRYGARVNVRSEVGQGSCFQVCFPQSEIKKDAFLL